MFNFNARNMIVLHDFKASGNFLRSLFTLNKDAADNNLLLNDDKLTDYKENIEDAHVSYLRFGRGSRPLRDLWTEQMYDNLNAYSDFADTYAHSFRSLYSLDQLNDTYIEHTHKGLADYSAPGALIGVQQDIPLKTRPDGTGGPQPPGPPLNPGDRNNVYTPALYKGNNLEKWARPIAEDYNLKFFLVNYSELVSGDISGKVREIAYDMGYDIDYPRAETLNYIDLYRLKILGIDGSDTGPGPPGNGNGNGG